MPKYKHGGTSPRSSRKGCENNQQAKSNPLDFLEGYILYQHLAVSICLALYLPKYANKQAKCLHLLRRTCVQGYLIPIETPVSSSNMVNLFSLLRCRQT